MGDTSLRRWLRRVGAGLLVISAVLLVLVVSEPVDADPTGDAVVVHAGGTGERLDRAVDLVEEGAASVLVVMYGDHPVWPQAPGLCRGDRVLAGTGDEPVTVLCPEPEPVTTIGEARALSRLIEERDWERVVVVTSDYHVRRAKLLVSRCTDAEVLAAASSSSLNPWDWTLRVGHEMAGLVQAAVFSC